MEVNNVDILSAGSLDESLAQYSAMKGLNLDIIPLIAIQTLSDESLSTLIKQLANQKKTIVFTSANAVKAVGELIPRGDPDWTVYTVGTKTTKAAAELLGSHTIHATAADSASLAALMIEDSIKEEVIFFCGNIRREDLPRELKKNQIPIREIIVYETIVQATAVSKKYDAILFFSPSEVRSFFSINILDDRAVLFAIGPTTGSEIKKHASNRIVIAKHPDKKQVLEEVIEYFQLAGHQN